MEHVENPTAFDDAGYKGGILKIVVAVLVFTGVFGITLLIYFPHSSWGKQEANLRLASGHLPILEERLRRLPGADQVKASRYTGVGGSISVDGNVPDERTAEAVVREVLATAPPVPVTFHLIFDQTNILQKIVQATPSSNK